MTKKPAAYIIHSVCYDTVRCEGIGLENSTLINTSAIKTGIPDLFNFEASLFVPEAFMLIGNNAKICVNAEIARLITENSKTVFSLEGTVKAFFQVECSRCLAPVAAETAFTVSERFSETPEDEELLCTAESLDLSEALLAGILQNIPLKALCGENCKGLCPVCGNNKNLSDCGCRVESANAFAGLKDLLSKDS